MTKLADIVKNQPTQDFAPKIYLDKSKTKVKAGVQVKGGWTTLNLSQCLLIIQNVKALEAAALAAYAMSEKPTALAELQAAKAAKDAAKAKPAAVNAGTEAGSALAAAMA